jgi:hypothetical protein
VTGVASALSLALTIAQAQPADPIAATFRGWHVEVEDDRGGPDARVTDATTIGCVTTISADKRSWAVDWSQVDTIGLADVFIVLRGPGLQIAVVADVRDAAGVARLRGMRDAMMAAQGRCRRLVR